MLSPSKSRISTKWPPRILCTSLAGTGSDDRDRLKPDCDGRPCGGTSNEGVTPDDTGGSRVVGSSEVVPDEPDGPDTTREGDAPVKIGTADTEEAGGRTPRAKGTPATSGMRQPMRRI